MAPNTLIDVVSNHDECLYVPPSNDDRIRCAVLGCGMMGQEHISYVMGYSDSVRIDFLCDPHLPSLAKAAKIMKDCRQPAANATLLPHEPTAFTSQEDLLQHVRDIDLLVIASPNYLHTPTLLEWGKHNITVLVEKPVAVSNEQIDQLRRLSQEPAFIARIWVAMEYRFIPAIAKLISLLPTVGEIKMVTIRENRYPFLHKIGKWNRDPSKTGDTMVEKCCHFFDLFRLITGQEADLHKVRALAQRGVNYSDEEDTYDEPIIDSAYVTLPFRHQDDCSDDLRGDGECEADERKRQWKTTIGCLELCMFAEGSRHQEEIVVTGTEGRLEAYLPENKVYMYKRPSHELWNDRSVPPPPSSIEETVFDCSNVREVHGIDSEVPTHGGYHYSSTGVEWHYLLEEMENHRRTGAFHPKVSLEDGIRAVEIGIEATASIVNATAVDGV